LKSTGEDGGVVMKSSDMRIEPVAQKFRGNSIKNLSNLMKFHKTVELNISVPAFDCSRIPDPACSLQEREIGSGSCSAFPASSENDHRQPFSVRSVVVLVRSSGFLNSGIVTDGFNPLGCATHSLMRQPTLN
jgi:hypothetical protein